MPIAGSVGESTEPELNTPTITHVGLNFPLRKVDNQGRETALSLLHETGYDTSSQRPLSRGRLSRQARMLNFTLLMNLTKILLTSALTLGTVALGATPAKASCGIASFYGKGDGFHGQLTASGQRFNTYSNSAAHPYLPFGTRLRVTSGRRSVIVTVNDRGPYSGGRLIDLSYAAFSRLASPSSGITSVCISLI